MINIIFTKEDLKNGNLLKKILDTLNENDKYILMIKKYYKNRTLSQNRLYWLWLNYLEKETGNDKNDLHEFFKMKFLEIKTTNIFDNEMKIYQSTAKLNKIEFMEYLDKIHLFVLENLNINLPYSSDENFEIFYLENA